MSDKKIIRFILQTFLIAGYAGLCCASLGLAFVSIAGEFYSSQQIGELCSHLVALVLCIALFGLVALAICFFVANRFVLLSCTNAGILLAVVLHSVVQLAPLYCRGDKAPAKANLTLLHFNLQGQYNTDKTTMFDQIRAESPDVVAVTELCGGWEKFLDSKMKAGYPYTDGQSADCFMRIYSKLPIKVAQLKTIKYGNRAHILARIEHPCAGQFTLLLAHPYIPVGKVANFNARNEEFEMYPSELKIYRGPSIVIGDLNCTPWSPYFKRLLNRGSLKDSECGFGLMPSWPTMYLPPFLPLDHVLVSKQVSVKERRLLTAAGSDHYPLLVRLWLPVTNI